MKSKVNGLHETGGEKRSSFLLLGTLLAFLLFALGATFPARGEAFVSDDFNACTLNTSLWHLYDPVGDASVSLTGAGTSNAELVFSIPGGASHDPWTVDTAPRLLQNQANTDFVIDAKFDSPMTQAYQGQGLIVQQDNSNWLRFDFFFDGTSTHVYAASKIAGVMSQKVNQVIPGGAPLYLRVARSLDQWTEYYSTDGTNWIMVVSFNQPLTVTAAGPLVDNFSSGSNAPAFTSLVDYVFDAANPISPEDGGPAPTGGSLTVTTTGSGSVTVNPDQASYACGTQVQLTAVPASGYAFNGWSGDLTGLVNPTTITMNSNHSVNADFIADTTPPTISSVTVSPGVNQAVLSWTTSTPTTSTVDYGTTSAYGQVATSSTLEVSHSITLSGLTASTQYHFQLTAVDAGGLSSSTADQVFTTASASTNPSGIISDDFSESALNTSLWQLYDPLGDATVTLVGTGTSNAELSFSVPGGVSHDPWTTDTAPRLLQAANNTDFTVETKFDSAVTQGYESQGIMVQQDASNWIRFDFFNDGSKVWVFAASKIAGVMSTKVQQAVAGAAAPIWLRVARSGNQWTESYSLDGTNWTTAGTFSQSLTVTAVGPLVGNFSLNGTSAPAFTSLVDYFFNAASPIVPEDPVSSLPLTVAVTGAGSVALSPSGGSYPSGTVVQLTATPASGWLFNSWSGDLTGSANPASLTMNTAKSVTANFVQQAVAPTISNVQVTPLATSATVTWTTDAPASSTVVYGQSTSYGLQVQDPTLVTTHSLQLTGLSAGTLYHYQVSSTDAGGTTTSGDLTFTTAQSGGIASGIVSDDFNETNLNQSLWTLVNPLGDATVTLQGAGTGNAELLFSVPGGASHDPWTTNDAARLMQPANNTDFVIEVKFISPVLLAYQEEGVLVQQDAQNWLRFDFFNDGTATHVYSASQIGGVMSTHINQTIPPGAPLYLRVARSGNQWTQSYSYDNINWLPAGSYTQALTVQSVGPYVGNFSLSGNNAPPFTADIDYFFNAASPIVPEDGVAPPPDTQPPLIQNITQSATTNSFTVSWLTDELASATLRYGTSTALSLGSVGHPDLLTDHSETVSGLQPQTTYYYQISTTDASGNTSLSAIQTVTTPSASGAPVIDVWYGLNQSFGQIGIPQRFVNILGTVTGPEPITSLSYSLNGGAMNPLSIGPDGYRLVGDGDFNIDLPVSSLLAGVNNVLIQATDSAGVQTTQNVSVTFANGNQWPQTYSIDWANASSIASVAQVVDGRWLLEPNGVRNAQVGYDRLIDIGDINWQNYEVTVPITVHSTQILTSNPPAVGVIVRWQGHTADGYQPARQWWPLGVFGMYRWNPLTPGLRLYDYGYRIYDTSGLQLQLGVTYMFKLRVLTVPGPATQYSFKVWPASQPEPSAWTMTYQEGSSDLQNGSLLLVAHYVDATFGNVTVVPVY